MLQLCPGLCFKETISKIRKKDLCLLKRWEEKVNSKCFQHFFFKCKSHQNWAVSQKALSKEVFVSMENVSPTFSQKGLGEPRREERNGDGGGHRKWSESLEAQRSPKQPCSPPCDPCKTCLRAEGFPHSIQLFL